MGPLGYATYFVSNKTSSRSVSKAEAVVVDLETSLIEDYIEEETDSSTEQVREPIVLQNEVISAFIFPLNSKLKYGFVKIFGHLMRPRHSLASI